MDKRKLEVKYTKNIARKLVENSLVTTTSANVDKLTNNSTHN